ncbi:hypothetical protein B0H11DRAFT_1912688 [Mycena galericulata]|nr:hypothetical protein B0H11DRAFT_1912688 [Mycena galericulata]
MACVRRQAFGKNYERRVFKNGARLRVILDKQDIVQLTCTLKSMDQTYSPRTSQATSQATPSTPAPPNSNSAKGRKPFGQASPKSLMRGVTAMTLGVGKVPGGVFVRETNEKQSIFSGPSRLCYACMDDYTGWKIIEYGGILMLISAFGASLHMRTYTKAVKGNSTTHTSGIITHSTGSASPLAKHAAFDTLRLLKSMDRTLRDLEKVPKWGRSVREWWKETKSATASREKITREERERRWLRAISRWLPNEVILQVIDAAPKPDQAALCRVSKLFHRLATPAVYRILELNQLSMVVNFCSAILSNPHLAELVRSLTVIDVRIDAAKAISSGIILNALKTLLRIEHLSISLSLLSDDNHLRAFLQCTFPRLVSCGIGVTKITDLVVSFLVRHPALTSVHLETSYKPSTPRRILLPKLQQFYGQVFLVPQIAATNLGQVELTCPQVNDVQRYPVCVLNLLHSLLVGFAGHGHRRFDIEELAANSFSESAASDPARPRLSLHRAPPHMAPVASRLTFLAKRSRRSQNRPRARGFVLYVEGLFPQRPWLEKGGREVGEVHCPRVPGVGWHTHSA